MHLDSKGEAAMTDVSVKSAAVRSAIAGCTLRMKAETFELISRGKIRKGDAFTVAKTAGILAAKKCADLIPLCHPLPLDHIEVRFFGQSDGRGGS